MVPYLHLLNIFILLSGININILEITYVNTLKTVYHEVNHYYIE